MTRFLFWLLLLANVALFIAMHWGAEMWGDTVVAQPALNEETMRLMDASELAQFEKTAKPVAASAVAEQPTMQLDNNMAAVITKPMLPTCLEWGDFTDAETKLVTTALSNLKLGKKLNIRQIEHATSYWVYIPPLKDKAAINQKIAQLKERGVNDYFIVQETGESHNALSLGVFKTQDAAQNFLDELRAKKIRSAQLGKRGKLKVSIFTFNDVDADAKAKLAVIQKDFSGSELTNVACH